MKSKIFILFVFVSLLVSCSTTKPEVTTPAPEVTDTVYDGLKIGMSRQNVIAILGKNFKYDMNNVTQTADHYVETLIWPSSDPNVAYVLTFVNNKLDRKTREQVVDENGKVIQIHK